MQGWSGTLAVSFRLRSASLFFRLHQDSHISLHIIIRIASSLGRTPKLQKSKRRESSLRHLLKHQVPVGARRKSGVFHVLKTGIYLQFCSILKGKEDTKRVQEREKNQNNAGHITDLQGAVSMIFTCFINQLHQNSHHLPGCV